MIPRESKTQVLRDRIYSAPEYSTVYEVLQQLISFFGATHILEAVWEIQREYEETHTDEVFRLERLVREKNEDTTG